MNRNKVFSNLLWRFAERIGAQLVTFVVSLVLARLLDPNVYGAIALVTVLLSIFQVFVDGGFANALIQKKDADDLDFSTVFYFNLSMCVVLYIVVYSTAPLMASFYSMPELIPVIRVLGVSLIISGVKNVQLAYVSKNLMFKKFFYATLGGTLGAAFIGIIMANNGYGIWALVIQNLFNVTIDTIVLWITVRWKPKRIFSIKRLRILFSYGWKLLASNLLNTIYSEIQALVIGKKYSPNQLAFYNKGQQLPSLIIVNINSSIDSVLLPVLSNAQDNVELVRSMTRRAIKTSIYVIAPLMMGLFAVADPLIRILLTDKWIQCVPFLRIFCITYMFFPVHTANLNAIKALGRSDLFLKLEVVKKCSGLIVLLVAMNYGVMGIAYSLLIIELYSQIVNTWPNRKLLNYRYIDQIKDIIPVVILSVLMGVVVYSIQYLGFSDWITLAIQIPCGVLLYFVGSMFLRIDTYKYIMNYFNTIIRFRDKK